MRKKSWYLDKDLRTKYVQEHFNKKSKFYREYFGDDASIQIERFKGELERTYNVKLI